MSNANATTQERERTRNAIRNGQDKLNATRRRASEDLKGDHNMGTIELDSKVKELRELRRMAEELAAEIDGLTDSIKNEMTVRGVDELTGTDWKASYKTVNSSRLDTAALKKALPDVAAAFTKQSSTRRFVLA